MKVVKGDTDKAYFQTQLNLIFECPNDLQNFAKQDKTKQNKTRKTKTKTKQKYKKTKQNKTRNKQTKTNTHKKERNLSLKHGWLI